MKFILHAMKLTCMIILSYAFVPLASSAINNCDIHDTVNITDSELLSNGSYLYNGIVIPPELTGTYDYEIYGGGRVKANPHLRGCVCQLKTCVKFCCEEGYTGQPNNWICQEYEYENFVTHVNITLNNGTTVSMPISEEFEIQVDIPCVENYFLVPNEDAEHEWLLFENGTLALPKQHITASKNEYCLNPQKSHDGSVHFMTPMHCKSIEPPKAFILNNILMAISVPFLLLTAIVYLIVPKLHTLYGKCLICYFISLAVGYGSLVVLNFNSNISDVLCRTFGYSTYFGFISAFTWLSVISFDLWFNTKGDQHSLRYSKYTTFLVYSAFTWGLAAILTAIVIFIQYFTNIPNVWKPRIGSDEFCWLSTDGWSPMIYFYGYMLICITFNLMVFILTARQILRAESISHSRYRLNKQNYAVLIRLFILMGLTWLLEIGSFLVGNNSPITFLFIPADFLNAAQGIIIFIITVCRPKVLIALKHRLSCRDAPSSVDEQGSLPEGVTLQDVTRTEGEKFLNGNE